LLPEESIKSQGELNITLENREDVQSFIKDLHDALEAESVTIRETELDDVRPDKLADLLFEDGVAAILTEKVYEDEFGRVYVPVGRRFSTSTYLTLSEVRILNGGARSWRKVKHIEPRYKGKQLAFYVIYLE
jgi:hypothetical protein